MPSIIEDLDIVEVIAQDIIEFAAGKPVTTTHKFGNITAQFSTVILPTGPVAPYVEFTGSFFSILGLVLGSMGEFAAGAPLSVAEKVGKTWYGTTVTIATGVGIGQTLGGAIA